MLTGETEIFVNDPERRDLPRFFGLMISAVHMIESRVTCRRDQTDRAVLFGDLRSGD